MRTDTLGVVLDLPILYVLRRVFRCFLGTGGLYKSDIESLFDISLNIFSLPISMLGVGINEGGVSIEGVVKFDCTVGWVAIGNGSGV